MRSEQEDKKALVSTAELKELIKQANKEALDDMYAAIGRGMLTRFLYMIGSGLVALAFALAKKYAQIKGISE